MKSRIDLDLQISGKNFELKLLPRVNANMEVVIETYFLFIYRLHRDPLLSNEIIEKFGFTKQIWIT